MLACVGTLAGLAFVRWLSNIEANTEVKKEQKANDGVDVIYNRKDARQSKMVALTRSAVETEGDYYIFQYAMKIAELAKEDGATEEARLTAVELLGAIASERIESDYYRKAISELIVGID